jgi:hypothetical protein
LTFVIVFLAKEMDISAVEHIFPHVQRAGQVAQNYKFTMTKPEIP